MKITIEADSLEEFIHVSNKITDAFRKPGAEPSLAAAYGDAAPAAAASKKSKTKSKPAAKKAAAAEPEVKEVVEQDAIEAVQKLVAVKDVDAAREALKEFRHERIGDLKKDQYAAFIEKCNSLALAK